jgi:hypothetical protein
MRQTLFWIQGGYYLTTGLWPIVPIKSFQWVTGPKTDHWPTGREGDHWLVMTVGLLIVAIATTLLAAAWRRSQALEPVMLAVLSALALTVIDIPYVSRKVLAPIYLVDAVAEIMLVAAWIFVLLRPDRSGAPVWK